MMQILKRMVPSWMKSRVRESVLGMMGVPWSRYGIPGPVMQHLKGKSGITLIDVGASEGEFTASLDGFCGLSRALLIEPQPMRCEKLHKKFAEPRYSVACTAVADKEGRLDMEILNFDYSSSILPVKRNKAEVNAMLDLGVREIVNCRLATLDTLVQEAQFVGPVDLLKIDVQGAEHLVLAGAKATLSRTRILWTEVSFQPLYEGSATIEQVIAACQNQGFLLKHVMEGFRANNGELLQADALFEKI